MDFWSLIEEWIGISEDTLLSPKQKRWFYETTIMDYLLKLREDDLPALRAAIRVSRDSIYPTDIDPQQPSQTPEACP